MEKPETVVYKFGGSVLDCTSNIQKVAELIKNEHDSDKRIVVIVSALKGKTDELLKMAQELSGNSDSSSDLDSLLSMGERTSARLMCIALKTLGVEAVLIDPENEQWPILTDDNYGNANPDLELTKLRVKKSLVPLLEEKKVPVICGFLGKDKKGRVTTLGRGGSDLTAVLLGKCLGTNSVILVKDVSGIKSGDPKKVGDSNTVKALDTIETKLLSASGAKVIQSKALQYKSDDSVIRVVGINEGKITDDGTVITGKSIPDLEISILDKPVQLVTIIGDNVTEPKLLSTFFEDIYKQKIEVVGATLESWCIMLLVVDDPQTTPFNVIHEIINKKGIGKSATCYDNLNLIFVKGQDFVKIPGIISKITDPLTKNRINVYSFLPTASSIKILVHSNDGERTLKLVKESFGLS
ncbi:MAG: aspartate kinase [Candidatus Jordarchaeum sp.]|uniref:aspartate kinase n=1 Tax=Candidatus Jordarchaeum sp. TaxID=2823881 RepID=UPI004049B902